VNKHIERRNISEFSRLVRFFCIYGVNFLTYRRIESGALQATTPYASDALRQRRYHMMALT
jgi:hypothetical protein